jgi:hypothetical protein
VCDIWKATAKNPACEGCDEKVRSVCERVIAFREEAA